MIARSRSPSSHPRRRASPPRSPLPAAGRPGSADRGCAAGDRHETPRWRPASAGAADRSKSSSDMSSLLQTGWTQIPPIIAHSAAPDCRTSRRDPEASPARRGDRIAHHETLPPAQLIAAGCRRIRSSRRPGSRDRVAAEEMALESRGRYASDQPDPDNRKLQMGRQGKDPRAVQQEARAGPPSGQRIAERFLARWETHPTQPGSSFVTLTQARLERPPVARRSVAARIPQRTRLVKPPRRRQPDSRAHHRARVLTIARRRQDTLAGPRPRLRALFWNRCWEPALVVSRAASVSSIARR